MLKEIAIHEIEGVRIGHGENRDAGTGCMYGYYLPGRRALRG